jgi:hypothetical protein
MSSLYLVIYTEDMDVRISLHHGPLSVEIDAESGEDYQEELAELLEFIQEYEELLPSGPSDTTKIETGGSTDTGQVSMNQFTNGSSDDTKDTTPSTDDILTSLAKRANAKPEQIRTIVDIDPSGDEPPLLLVDADELGDSKTRRQFVGSLMILAAWDDCYETEERMSSSLLKDVLEYSGIESSNMYNMYQLDGAEAVFDKTGRGGNTKIELTRPGKRKAYKMLREFIS